MAQIFLAGLRSMLGTEKAHTTLEIYKGGGRLSFVVQEIDPDTGNMKSKGVSIENAQGDIVQAETYKLLEALIEHIHEMHKKHPAHPAYIVKK